MKKTLSIALVLALCLCGAALADADGNYYLTEALQFACAVTADTQFIDASDPGAEPVVHTAKELIDALCDDRSSFQNIEITFNDDGELAVLQLNPAA